MPLLSHSTIFTNPNTARRKCTNYEAFRYITLLIALVTPCFLGPVFLSVSTSKLRQILIFGFGIFVSFDYSN
jgi:hypothetical protein